jgi:hypothetical protein
MATYRHAKAPADDCHQQLHPFPHLVRTWGGLQRGSLLQFCTKLFSVFLLPQEKRTKSDSNSRFPLSILFIFRLAAALPHLPHAAMTSMAWNRCISSYRIIPVSSFVLNFHALTRTKLKFMAGDYVSIWWSIASQAAGLEPGILIVGRESVFYNCTISGRAHARGPIIQSGKFMLKIMISSVNLY